MKRHLDLVIVNERGEPFTVVPDIQNVDFKNEQQRNVLLGAIEDMVTVMTTEV